MDRVVERHKQYHLSPSCARNQGILLANSEGPKFVYPTCLLGRQKSLGNLRKKKYYQNFEVDSPTVSGRFLDPRCCTMASLFSAHKSILTRSERIGTAMEQELS